jgi:hypothetical protein
VFSLSLMARSAGALLAGLVRLAPFDKLLTGGFMTTTNFLVPPRELVQKWWDNVPGTFTSLVDETELATQAAQWGWIQALEACGRWLEDQLCMPPDARADVITQLNGSLRPKPPSLKAQALEALEEMNEPLGVVTVSRVSIIRRALEALDD